MNRHAVLLSISAVVLAAMACNPSTLLFTPTPYPCPQATAELFYVEPIPATTDALTVTVTVVLGNMEEITVVTESGVFTSTTGEVEVTLLPDTEHHLEVRGKVRETQRFGNCTYGGYTLRTSTDKNGQPLVIVQGAGPTPTPCPQGTPEPLIVEPIPTETTETSVTVSVVIGNGDQVTVETESGVYTAEGEFGYFNPALIDVPLVPNSVNHIRVSAHVRPFGQPGECQYGNYTLSTSFDRDGNELVIEQKSP